MSRQNAYSFWLWNQKIANRNEARQREHATSLMIGKFSQLHAKAESLPTMTEKKKTSIVEEEEKQEERTQDQKQSSPLSEFLESNTEAIDVLKSSWNRSSARTFERESCCEKE
ncbi:hypothetical protein CCACVL1_28790 [Corchorus capsularis]|uniref:Uncharacterized protein n=1 Tax=Corchorus capsularis TaxID=210143 RepID=A0A1R3G578_COCAP|nr:hypothetical protein CCACVL1_28790 [Corchorus capsularis]